MNAAVPNVGLLLIWFGLCLTFLSDKVTVARLLTSITVPIRRAYFPKKIRSTLERL